MSTTDFLILSTLVIVLVCISWVTGKYSKIQRSRLTKKGDQIDITASGPVTRSKIPNIATQAISKVEYIQSINPVNALIVAFSSFGYFAPLGGDIIKVYFNGKDDSNFFVVTDIDSAILDELKTRGMPIVGNA